MKGGRGGENSRGVAIWKLGKKIKIQKAYNRGRREGGKGKVCIWYLCTARFTLSRHYPCEEGESSLWRRKSSARKISCG